MTDHTPSPSDPTPAGSVSGSGDSKANPPAVRDVEIQHETETAHGWSYTLSIFWEGGRHAPCQLTLNWADHDHWSAGALPPSRVAAAVARAAAAALGPPAATDGMPARSDASSLRRRIPNFDDAVRALL